MKINKWTHEKKSSACGLDAQRLNGNAPSHLTRQTACVSHRKPAIDQITSPVCKHTHRQIRRPRREGRERAGRPYGVWRTRDGTQQVRYQIRAFALTNCIPIQGNGVRSPLSFLQEASRRPLARSSWMEAPWNAAAWRVRRRRWSWCTLT